MNAKIFVSYSRKDKERVRLLVPAFEKMGYEVWVDWDDIPPATDWLDQIKRGIESADSFVFFLSPDSAVSEVCNIEVNHAAKYNKRIIPIVLRDTPAKDVNPVIRRFNWINIREEDDLEAGLKRFRDAVELDFEWVARHNRLLGKALEWHHGKEASLLLHGNELRRVLQQVEAAKDKEPALIPLQKMFLEYSVKNEKRRRVFWSVVSAIIIILAVLTTFALYQRSLAILNEQRANLNAELANEQRLKAETNEALAIRNAEEALAAKEEAEIQRTIAEAERERAEERARFALAQQSAARAQIYQSQPGELYTSTLLAIASWTTAPSEEAEEILRKNISLLPIPLRQTQRTGSINALTFNAQGDVFVTAGADGNACVWKASDGELLFCRTSPKSVNDAVFSPNGELLVTGDESGLVQFIRAKDGEALYSYQDRAGGIVRDLDVRNSGDQVAVTFDDGRITLVEMQTGKRKYDLQAVGRLRVAAFSPDGRYIAAGSLSGNITVWDIIAGGAPISSGQHRGEVLALAFSPDSRYLVSGGADGYAIAVRVSDWRELYRHLHEDRVTDIAFNPKDGSWFATVSADKRIRLWNTLNGEERLRMAQDGQINAVEISTSGQWLATTGADRTVRVWNASTGTQVFEMPLKGTGNVLAFNADGTRLMAGDASGEINLWDIAALPAPANYLQFNDLAGDVHFSPSGEWVAASSGPKIWLLGTSRLSTLKAGSLDPSLLTLNGDVTELLFSPDSVWLGASTANGQVLVYNMQSRQPRTLFQTALAHHIAFTPDSAHLIVAGESGAVESWSLESFRKTADLAAEGSGVVAVAAGPNYIALGMADKIQVMDADGNLIAEIEAPGVQTLLAFSADGSLFAASNSAGLVKVWQVDGKTFRETGELRKEFVSSLAFSPAGDALAVGSRDSVFLLDPLTMKETSRVPLGGDVGSLAYSTDGSLLATASQRAVQFWETASIPVIASQDLTAAACTRLTANLSQAQWSSLFSGEAYRVLCEGLPVP
ncbi:MAG: TIR domain-containing protein [Chloroflexota bacterium]|nr:TIR domain-containing protein [Chloroflexota bacterium]MBI5702541.1 TIR domain-containing protein [Chloroflexota bacterium]